MTALERAVGAIARFLEQRRVPYMLIGGVANLVWGQPRATFDVDTSVLVEESAWPQLIRDLKREFHLLPKRPLAFLRDTHVLPLETDDGVRIDLLWARLPYEHTAIARATVEAIGEQRVRACRPEDLIIHKIVSERPKDREDVRGLINRQAHQLDRRYLTRTVRSLADALDQPELLTFLTTCLRHAKARS